MSTKTYNNTSDGFAVPFPADEHEQFINYLKEVEADSHWEFIEAKETYFVPLASVDEGELALGSGEGYKDSVETSPLPICVVLPDKRKYLIRPYLFKSIKQHHRDNAKILTDMLNKGAMEALCEHISASCPFLKKKILMLVRGDKISGWFSDFNGNWSQSKQVDFFEAKMRAGFCNLTFKEAEVSHYFTKATYGLDETLESDGFISSLGVRPSVLSAYVDAWEKAGLSADALMSAQPLCQFITGESGLTAIEVRPFIRVPRLGDVPLGGTLSVNHRGDDDAVWSKFETFPEQVAVLYQKGLAGLEHLCKRRVYNPYCCTTQILANFRASIPVEHLIACAEDAEIFWPREDKDATCYAIEIFNNINEMVTRAESKLAPMRRLRNTEMVARLLTASVWDTLDVPRLGKYCGKSGVLKAVAADEEFGF